MDRFVNPNDSAFRNALNAEIYVDNSAEKTVSFITQTVLAELRDIYGDIIPVREMSLGRGFADYYPVLLVELKWNKDAATAISQIKEKRYAEALEDYAGEILLVGINYDKKTKEYSCDIEKLVK